MNQILEGKVYKPTTLHQKKKIVRDHQGKKRIKAKKARRNQKAGKTRNRLRKMGI